MRDCGSRHVAEAGCDDASRAAGLRHTVEEINDSRSPEEYLGAHDEGPFPMDQRLDNFRSVAPIGCGDADVAANGVTHESSRPLVGVERVHVPYLTQSPPHLLHDLHLFERSVQRIGCGAHGI